MSKMLGVCVVGCGHMGQIHAQGWQAIPAAKVIAVVDALPERAQKLARLLDCAPYTDYTAAISRPDVDVVSVCIPTCYHAEVTIAAAELGKHVLCEKPIALTLIDADRMIAAAQANQVKLGLGFMRRHTPVLADLKARLANGEFGHPGMYHAADVRELRPKREMHDARANGGPVIDMAVHLIDVWNTIFDSAPVSVSAQGFALGKDRPEIAHLGEIAVDTASIQVRYASGDVGVFVMSWGLPPKVNPENHPDQFYGAEGLGEVYYAAGKQELRNLRENGFWQTLAISHENMYNRQIAAFARWVLTDEPFPATGEDGKLALKVALAALESIRIGETVHL